MKLLVVDDNRESRVSLSEFLMEIGHEVHCADDGTGAVKMLREETFQLVISDIRMPRLDGNQLLDFIKKPDSLCKDVDLILITAYGDIKNAVDAMKKGAFEYLLKPINVHELAVTIAKIEEIQNIKNELHAAKKELLKAKGLDSICAKSKKMKAVYDLAGRMRSSKNIPILLEGETGTGKEVVAQYIHFEDKDYSAPFVAINCAAISPGLFESEMFGYEPGAFTGGNPKGQKGKIELAGNGTIFFDEIGELSSEYQAKLLRLIQEREFYRIGGTENLQCEARIICSTNIDIEKGVAENTFRKDLFFRLSAGHIKLPPLRERKGDIAALTNIFIQKLREKRKTTILKLDKTAVEILENYHWVGNVRELKNFFDRLALLIDEKIVTQQHVKMVLQPQRFLGPVEEQATHPLSLDEPLTLPSGQLDLNELNLNIVKAALIKFRWNKSKTADYLRISRSSLYTYLKKIESIDA